MLIFRAEDSNGRGPFSDLWPMLRDAMHKQRRVAHDDSVATYPNIYNDRFRHGRPPAALRCRCGAISLTQWCHWFPGECAKVLAQYDYHLAVYEVPDEDVWEGRKQVLFRPDNAKLLRRLDPVSLEPILTIS